MARARHPEVLRGWRLNLGPSATRDHFRQDLLLSFAQPQKAAGEPENRASA